MFTPRETFIIAICEKLHEDVADACESLLDTDVEEIKLSVKKLHNSVQYLSNLIQEDNEY